MPAAEYVANRKLQPLQRERLHLGAVLFGVAVPLRLLVDTGAQPCERLARSQPSAVCSGWLSAYGWLGLGGERRRDRDTVPGIRLSPTVPMRVIARSCSCRSASLESAATAKTLANCTAAGATEPKLS